MIFYPSKTRKGAEQGFDKVESLGKRKDEGSGEGRGNLS